MNIAAIAEQLTRVGYVVVDEPLDPALSAALYRRCQDDGSSRFQAAQIGRGAARQQLGRLRGDVISWLDASNGTDHAYLLWMEALRLGLNSALFLGLFDFECHYAIYGAGTGYARHTDVLHGTRNRVLSTVFYLNDEWQTGDGGELRLFAPDGDGVIATVRPQFGTLLIFLSESFPHEVLMAHRHRRSIAGWFRVRAD
ncbi:MAG: proline hydroxylase [Betaproteobacteria bacterium HGW-Betaproteobacteria-12]|nr:MAG: proline hydroxylase [Betaproteobacteria bacterium HGW-Betaproteobacteria-12]